MLDCDDEWLPTHLETLWDARNGHVLVGTAMLGAGADPKDHRIYGWTGRRPRVLVGPADVAVPENKLTASSVLMSRARVLDAGGFRELPRAADLDHVGAPPGAGNRGSAIPRVTALYHVHPGRVSVDPR